MTNWRLVRRAPGYELWTRGRTVSVGTVLFWMAFLAGGTWLVLRYGIFAP